VSTASDAHNVANVVGAKFVHTENNARFVVSVVEAKFAHMGNSAHNVANVGLKTMLGDKKISA
tara:strand:- start:460 stop:648 length:189 start_codon:yes stop_codon:yes gene_type:complete